MSAYLEPLEGGRCRRWNLVVSVGSGKSRRRRSKAFTGGKREALQALKDYEASITIPTERSGFTDFAHRWNDARLASGAIAASTHEKYYWHIRAFEPLLCKNLEDVRPSDVQAAYAALRGSWSGATMRSAHNSLHRVFQAAKSEGLVSSNPLEDVDAPKVDTKEKRALSPAEAAEMMDALDISDNRQFAIYLVLACGLRRKEVLGLEWRDVSGVVHIRREVTKSASGVRDIPLGDAAEVVEKRRKLVNASLEEAGGKLSPTDNLCCGLDGRPLTEQSLRKWWERNRKSFQDMTLHELRHTYLTNLAQAGVHPAVMQRLAGHSSINTTLKIYTHVNNADLYDAAKSVNDLRKSARKSARIADDEKTGQTK